MSVTVVQNENLPFTRVLYFVERVRVFASFKITREVKQFFSRSSSLVWDQFIKVDN